MNKITQAVLNYKDSNNELDFLPIWKHFEPKIKYMSYNKATQVLVDTDTLFEAAVEGLLTAVRKFDINKKCEFSTYFYIWARSMMLKEIAKSNIPKRVINNIATSLYVEDGDEDHDGMLLPIIDTGPNPEEQLITKELEEII